MWRTCYRNLPRLSYTYFTPHRTIECKNKCNHINFVFCYVHVSYRIMRAAVGSYILSCMGYYHAGKILIHQWIRVVRELIGVNFLYLCITVLVCILRSTCLFTSINYIFMLGNKPFLKTVSPWEISKQNKKLQLRGIW